jgi:hypothetical protein
MNSFYLTAIAALETADICIRQASKDSRKVWGWYYSTFIGPEAIARYEAIGRALGVLCCLVVTAGMVARIGYTYLVGWCALQVDQAQLKPAEATPVLTPVYAPTFFHWLATVVFRVHATILRYPRHQRIVANTLVAPQLQPCL